MSSKRSTVNQAKDAERWIAAEMGGVRIPSGTWQAAGDADVDLGYALVQAKQRSGPAWLWKGLEQITLACAGLTQLGVPLLPLLVIVEKPGHGGRPRKALVCMSLENWRLWNGGGDA